MDYPQKSAPGVSLEDLEHSWWGLGMELARLLVSQRPQQCQICREASIHECRRYGPIKFFFKALAAGTQRVSLTGPSLLHGTAGSQKAALAGPPLLHRASMRGERGYSGGSTHCAWLSSSTLLPLPPGFSPKAFSVSDFFPSSPQAISLQSTAVLIPELLSNLHAPAPGCAHQWTCVPVWSMYCHGTDCLCVSYSIQNVTEHLLHPPPTASNVSLLFQPISLDLESRTPTSIRQCSVRTDVSIDVFLMHPWREMYSMFI